MLDETKFVATMRRAPTAVSIVATNGSLGPHGATVSAVCSLSVSPPSVLICLNRKSRILTFIEEHGAFSVNFLSEGHEDLGLAFSGAKSFVNERTFQETKWVMDPASDMPILREASASFTCLHAQTLPFGSHRILIGKVEQATKTDNTPISYWNGDFRTFEICD